MCPDRIYYKHVHKCYVVLLSSLSCANLRSSHILSYLSYSSALYYRKVISTTTTKVS
jgi:hypothetical protein